MKRLVDFLAWSLSGADRELNQPEDRLLLFSAEFAIADTIHNARDTLEVPTTMSATQPSLDRLDAAAQLCPPGGEASSEQHGDARFDGAAPTRDYRAFDRFLCRLSGDIYPELPSEPHFSITRMTIEALLREGVIAPGTRVLDVGCGQGLALRLFSAAGLTAVGITLGCDYEVCRANGFEVYAMDQNFMTFTDNAFDFLWCRHVLEHSVAPLFTLTEYRRVLAPHGRLYIEVPAPDTAAHHEANPNHYSVLPHSSWLQLFAHAGFRLERSSALTFTVPCGPDTYWSFLLSPIARESCT